MATEFKDGSFSETKPFQEAMDDFLEFVKIGEAVAFHVGSNDKIRSVKEGKNLQRRIKNIEKRINDLEKNKPLRSLSLYLPNTNEILKYSIVLEGSQENEQSYSLSNFLEKK